MTEADLRGADLTEVDFLVADLRGADLRGADFFGANLTGADLTEADFSGSDLRREILTGADYSGSDLIWANLTGVDLTGANLAGSDLSWANLTDANLTDANLTGAILINTKIVNNLIQMELTFELKNVILLDSDLLQFDECVFNGTIIIRNPIVYEAEPDEKGNYIPYDMNKYKYNSKTNRMELKSNQSNEELLKK